MASIPLPALGVHSPESPDPLQSYGRLMALKGMAQNQQMQQQQVEQGQMDIDSQKALMKAYTEAGGDPDKTTKLAAQYGVKPQALLQWQNSVLEQKKNTLDLVSKQGDMAKQQAELMMGAHDAVDQAKPEDRTAVYQQQLQGLQQRGVDVSKLPPQYPGDEQFKFIGATVKSHAQMVEDALKTAETAKNAAQGQEAGTAAKVNQNKLDLINQYKQNPQALMSQVDAAAPANKYASLNMRTKQQVTLAMQQGDVEAAKAAIKQASEQVSGIEKEINPQVQQGKIAVAQAEGKARQLVEGMEKPVYAVDQKTGQKTLMSATDAIQGGMRTMLPVTAKEVGEDTMLINRLGDVHQKIARYEQAFDKPISDGDKYVMSKILGDDKFKAGVFGSTLPVDFMNKLDKARNLGNISPEAQKRLAAYYNARESMTGYNRVLTGSGRSSEKSLELQLDTLADPIAPDSYAKQAFGQFKENLGVVGQGMPRIPGVKSPEDIERETKGSASNDPLGIR